MRRVFNSGHYHFFADQVTGWYLNTNKKGKRILMLRSKDGGLWDVDEDQHDEFIKWIHEQQVGTTRPKAPNPSVPDKCGRYGL